MLDTEKKAMEVNDVTEKIIGCAIEVQRNLKIGLLESAYQSAMAYEMNKTGLQFEAEKIVPVRYKDVVLKVGFRCDFLVERLVIVECKAVKDLSSIDVAQILNYLKLTDLKVGLLINFHHSPIVAGIKRVSN
jgi:GxxExxY protein